MQRALDEMARRRTLQEAHNQAQGIIPRGVVKPIVDILEGIYAEVEVAPPLKVAEPEKGSEALTEKQRQALLQRLEREMHGAANQLEFEKAAALRDQIKKLQMLWLALG